MQRRSALGLGTNLQEKYLSVVEKNEIHAESFCFVDVNFVSIKLSGEEFAHKTSCVQAQRSQSVKARGKDVPDSLLIWQV